MMLTSELNGIELIIILISKSVLLLLTTFSVLWFARRESAAARHFYLTVSMVILLLLPFYYSTLPIWNIKLLSNPFDSLSITSLPSKSEPAGHINSDDEAGNLLYSRLSAKSNDPEKSKSYSVERAKNIILIIWISGSSGILFWIVAGRIYSNLIFSRSSNITDQRFSQNIKSVYSIFKIRKKLKVRLSDKIKVPIVVGLLSPKIILPVGALKWQQIRLKAILFHELSHIKRNDIIIQFLAQLTCAIYWFNPLIWILESKLMIERERASDNFVLQNNIKPSEYAQYLMETSEELGDMHRKRMSFTGMAEGTDFKDRVLSILDPGAKRNSVRLINYMKTFVLLFLLILIASFTPWSEGTDVLTQNDMPNIPGERGTYYSGVKQDSIKVEMGKKGQKSYYDDLEFILMNINSTSASDRKDVVMLLGQIKDRRAVPALINALNDKNESVRAQSAIALGEIKDQRAVDALANTLMNDSIEDVRAHAVIALGLIGDDKVYELVLYTSKNDESDHVRKHALEALSNLIGGK